MNLEIQPQYIRAAIVTFVAAVVGLTSFFGFRAGKDLARSDVTLQQIKGVVAGLNYFYADQDRYPTPQEFIAQSALGVYVAEVPVWGVASKLCPVPYVYDTFDQRSFRLTYCLPRGFGGQLPGEHMVTERDGAL